MRSQPSFIEEARRAQIIEAAISTIAEVGYLNTSLAKIADHAGISKGVISYHFGDKAALIEAVAKSVVGELDASLERDLAEVETYRASLEVLIRGTIRHLCARPDHMVVLGEIVTHGPRAEGGQSSIGEIDQYTETAAFLLEGQQAGEFRAFDAGVMAIAIVQSIEGVLGQWMVDGTTDLDLAATELVMMFDLATRKEPSDDSP